MKKAKKGFMDMNRGVMLMLGLVVVALVASIGSNILQTNQNAQILAAGGGSNTSLASNISGYGLAGLNAFATQLSNVGLVGGLALILMVLFGGLYFLFAGRGGRS